MGKGVQKVSIIKVFEILLVDRFGGKLTWISTSLTLKNKALMPLSNLRIELICFMNTGCGQREQNYRPCSSWQGTMPNRCRISDRSVFRRCKSGVLSFT